MRRFDGKTCLVTGAAGEIGLATARVLAQEGASLALLDRRAEALDQAAAELRDLGVEPLAVVVDQVDRASVNAAVTHMTTQFGHIDCLFANAGYGRYETFLNTSPDQWARHVDINLTGTFNVCQSVARTMVSQGLGGSVVINASSAAVMHADKFAAYCASKAAIRMLACSMASELGGHRIRVNTVMPGVIETAMTAPMLAVAAHRAAIEADTPAGRLGSADDVADLVCFLLSEQASFITGESILVDGGQRLHAQPRWFRTDYRKPHQERWEIPQ